MVYTEKQLTSIMEDYESIGDKLMHLQEAFIMRRYDNKLADEYAKHGFVRRLKTLRNCIDNIFRILPPNIDIPPAKSILEDVKINLQAFIINVFGCIDNLAWVLVYQNKLAKEDGKKIPNSRVGLRADCIEIHSTLSPEFKDYIQSMEDWFGYLESYRHALAHRIPLYVPPYELTPDEAVKYTALETRIIAALKRHDFDEYEALSYERDSLGRFRPIMAHSINEEKKMMYFHIQILHDFVTIEEVALKIIEEMN